MRSVFSIKRADDGSYDDEIQNAQRVCLPDDKPIPIHGYDWWIVIYTPSDMVAGFAAMRSSYRWLKCGYLARAGVIPSFRGNGLQRRLIRARERQAKRNGWEAIFSDTRDNPASSNTLARCGYKMFTPSKPWGARDTLYWRKRFLEGPFGES